MKPTLMSSFYSLFIFFFFFFFFSLSIDDKMAAILVSSQNKNTSGECNVQYALDSVQYAENIARLPQCKVNRDRFRYLITHVML